MQKNQSNKDFRGFLKEKGYYIVLLLCAVAVGTSGYFLLTRDKTNLQNTNRVVVASTAERQDAAIPSSNVQDAVATQPATTELAEPAPAEPAKLETAMPLEGETVTGFAAEQLAYNETTRDWRVHEGIDLSADLGQQVFAAADGTVYAIYEDKSYGMTVVLKHDNGYTTHYSNLDKEVAVSVGDVLSRGDVLGTVGATACVEAAAPIHLHFGVYKDNRPVNPQDFFES